MSAAQYDPLFQQAGQQFNVDPDIVRALVQQESNFNPNAFNKETGASGLGQFIPATAKAYGIDPKDPVQAINTTAQMFRENLDRFGGDVSQAVAGHFAGPNQKLWGPKTQQYISDVANKFNAIKGSAGFVPGQSPQQAAAAQETGDDPIMAALSGKSAAPAAQAPTAASDDPIMAALSGKSAPMAAIAKAPPQQSAQPAQQVSFLGRMAKGINDPLDAALQMASHALPTGVLNALNSVSSAMKLPAIGPMTQDTQTPQQLDQNIAGQEKQYQANRTASGSTGFDAGRMLGNMIGAAPLVAAAPVGGGMATGAALGAANGALTPVIAQPGQSFAGQKGMQIGLGALTGGVAAPIASGIGKAVSGAGGAAQKLLADAGVTMTPGQILGGALGRTEEKLTSVPVLGDFIKNAQQRSVQSLNTAAYNKTLAPIGEKYSGPVGNEGIAGVQQKISDAYDGALSKMNFNAADPAFNADITKLGGMAQNMPTAQAQTFLNVLKTQIFGKIGPQGTMDGQTLKGVQSELARTARGYAGDPSFDNRQLGAAIGEIKNAVDASLARTNPAEAVQQLANANSAYANFVRLRAAAGSQGAGNNGGVFTAAQLSNAVRSSDKSVGKGNFATGDALMQDLSGAGQQVLGSKYPNSGTPGRSAMMLAIPALAGHAFLPPSVMPVAALAGGLASAPYTAMGQKMAQALLMSRPAGAQQIGQGISQYGSALAPALGAALLNSSNR